MKCIFIQAKVGSTVVSEFINSLFLPSTVWFWITVFQFILILFLSFKLLRNKKNLDFSDIGKGNLKKSQELEIDMGKLMNSINNSSDLYKELSRKCHPDRFVNSPNQELAQEIFQEIARHKRNHEKLIALRDRAISELNLRF